MDNTKYLGRICDKCKHSSYVIYPCDEGFLCDECYDLIREEKEVENPLDTHLFRVWYY
jgi:hypothetical protein